MRAILSLALLALALALASAQRPPPPRPRPRPPPPRPRPPPSPPPRPRPPPSPPRPRPRPPPRPRPRPPPRPRPRPPPRPRPRPPPPKLKSPSPPPPRPRPPRPRPPPSPRPPRPPPPPRPRPSPPPPRPRPPPPSCAALGNKCEVNPDCCSKECKFYASTSSYKCCLSDVVPASEIKNIDYLKPPWSNAMQCKSGLDCCNAHCVSIGGVEGCLPCVPVPLTKCVQDSDCCFGAKCNTISTKCCLPSGALCKKQVNTSQPVTNAELCCSGTCSNDVCTSCVGVGSTGCTTDANCCFGAKCTAGRCCVPAGGACITGIENSDCCSKSCTAGKCD